MRSEAVPSAAASALVADSIAGARKAHLHYVDGSEPGLQRVRRGRGFCYLTHAGKPVRDRATLERIAKLAIPPAWTRVWICADPDGHLQATGRDARGRKQYRYHARWRQVRDETKYHRMLDFGRALPAIRAQTAKHLALPGLPREKVLATVVRLLETALIRVGNREYARDNGSFGLTTLRNKHVSIHGSKVHFEFRGKHGIVHAVDLEDRRLGRVVKQCRDLPGQELFQYVGADGQRHRVGSSDVNDYLRALSRDEFTAKDFRTWGGTMLAAEALLGLPACTTQRQAKRNLLRAIEQVADRLGNTKAVCRKCYVHPAVMDAYLAGKLSIARHTVAHRPRATGLSSHERAVLAFLKRALSSTATRAVSPHPRARAAARMG
jgi:DNA topoisomerase-1